MRPKLRSFSSGIPMGFTDLETNRRATPGAWEPTHFKFVTINGTQYLYVSDKTSIWIRGAIHDMERIQTGCNIKGSQKFSKPGTYRKVHKILK